MKPIVLYLQKQNLFIGIIVAIALVLFLKRYSSTPTESFLSLRALSSLCNRKYKPEAERAGIPNRKKKVLKPIKPPKLPPQKKTPPYIREKKNAKPQCKFGIDINPPSQKVNDALTILTPIDTSDIDTVEKSIDAIPEFENIMASPDKQEVVKKIIILDKLFTDPPADITDEQIQHIAITILSSINTVDPQIASLASAYYSNTDQTPETNPFTDLAFPNSEIILNTDAVKIITAEPIRELSPEAIEQITGVLNRIKIFMPYDECTAILTRNI